MTASVLMLLHRTEQAIERHLRASVSRHCELTPVQFRLLRLVLADPGRSQLEIGQRLGIDRSTAAGIFHHLALRGLLTRHTSPDDARVKQLVVTAKGRKEHDRYETHYSAADEALLRSLPADHRAEFMEMLRRLSGSA